MKKITLLIGLLLAFCTSGYSQFSESFEAATFPAGWTVLNGGDANTWITIDLSAAAPLTAHSGNYVAGIVYTTPTAHDDYLVTPAITVTSGVNDRFSFWARSRDPLYPEQIDLVLSNSTATAAAFTTTLQAGIAPESGLNMYKYSYDLSSYIGQTVYIGFHSTTADMFIFDIDDVVSDAVPFCQEVLNANATDITAESATINWDAVPGSTGYEYVLDTNAADPTSGTATTATTYAASGLMAGTAYYFHVRNNCGGSGESTWLTLILPVGCLDAVNGLYPADPYTPATCDGTTENVITTLGFASEYSNVNVTSGQTYVFSSSISTDFVTISTDDGATASAFGTSPLTWVSTITGVVRFYIHTDDQCGTSSDFRSRIVTCGVQSTDTPDYANLQFPPTIDVEQGNSVTVYGQVYEAGLTDIAPNIVGQAPGIEAWVGISPEGDNSNPNTWTVWIPATWNAGNVSNNDEYQAGLVGAQAPGTYYYATRFRLNNGPFVYGGYSATGGNFWDGITNVSGVLTVTAAPAAANDECAGAIALTPGGTFATSATTVNNFSSTTGTNIPSCQTNTVNEVWFSVVVPASGNVTLETGAVAGSQYTDSVVTAYSGTCGTLTEIGCNDDILSPNFFSRLPLTGLTPGSTIYASVGRFSFMDSGFDGQFQVAAYDASLLATQSFDMANFSYYPNPVTNALHLTSQTVINNVAVFNLLGQQIKAQTLNANQATIDMSGLANGAYMVKVTSGTQVKTIKVIKQ